MSQVMMKIPDMLASLPEEERDRLIRGGLYEATRARIRQLKQEIAESREHLQKFERRYGVSFTQFESEILPTLDTLEAHEDYNDWFFWHSLLAEDERLLSELKWAESD